MVVLDGDEDMYFLNDDGIASSSSSERSEYCTFLIILFTFDRLDSSLVHYSSQLIIHNITTSQPHVMVALSDGCD